MLTCTSGPCSIWTLRLRPTAVYGSHCRIMSTNTTQWWSHKIPWGWWWHSQLADNHGNNEWNELVHRSGTWYPLCCISQTIFVYLENTENIVINLVASWVRRSWTSLNIAILLNTVWPQCTNARWNRRQQILTASPMENWMRQPGRPCTTWMKTIQQDLKCINLSLNEATDSGDWCLRLMPHTPNGAFHKRKQESPAIADKPVRRESLPKITPIRRAYNVVADNTGLSSFV